MKATITSIIFGLTLIGGALLFAGWSFRNTASQTPSKDNVSVQNGSQIIEIRAKGGYIPRKSIAQSGLPTTIRFTTDSSFDCSIAVHIPTLSIGENLPPSGKTDISIGTSTAGILRGTCAMGMYTFDIEFR